MFINKAMVFGNLTRDPELKALPSGMQVCSFSLATNRVFNDRDGKRQEIADYHNIVVFDTQFSKQAENCAKYLTKGSSAYVEGRMQTRSWEKDGVKMYRTEVVADRVQFGPRSGGVTPTTATTPTTAGTPSTVSGDDRNASVLPDYPEEDINPDDIPF